MRLIDADAITIKDIQCSLDYGGHSYEESIKVMLDEAPIIDAEVVRHGKWVKDGIDDDDEGHYFCLICKSANYFDEVLPFDKYCSECGAKMDGGVEDAAD